MDTNTSTEKRQPPRGRWQRKGEIISTRTLYANSTYSSIPRDRIGERVPCDPDEDRGVGYYEGGQEKPESPRPATELYAAASAFGQSLAYGNIPPELLTMCETILKASPRRYNETLEQICMRILAVEAQWRRYDLALISAERLKLYLERFGFLDKRTRQLTIAVDDIEKIYADLIRDPSKPSHEKPSKIVALPE